MMPSSECLKRMSGRDRAHEWRIEHARQMLLVAKTPFARRRALDQIGQLTDRRTATARRLIAEDRGDT